MRHIWCLALVVVAAGCGRQEGDVYRMTASSMEPTLHCARPQIGCLAQTPDQLFATPYGDDRPERGDIVVFETPPQAEGLCGAAGLYVKRVIGLPGETWSERHGGVYIAGRRLREPYVHDRDTASYAGGRIPPGRYLVLGDNRPQSCDSRVWGLVPLANIQGRVVEVKRGSKRIHFR